MSLIFGFVTLAHHVISPISLFQSNVETINDLVQGSCGGKQATKKGKLCYNKKQVNSSMMENALFPVKYCPKSGVNLFLVTCEFAQGETLENDAHKNITLKRVMNWLCLIISEDKNGWVVGVEVLPVPPNVAHVMTDTPIGISDDKDIYSAETKFF